MIYTSTSPAIQIPSSTILTPNNDQSNQRYNTLIPPLPLSPSPRTPSLINAPPSKPPSGILVSCDPSIKAIILKIDHDKHDYIIEDLDDQTVFVKEDMLGMLKARLDEVR